MTSHTKEPWRVDEDQFGIIGISPDVPPQRFAAHTIHPTPVAERVNTKDDAARIVACVNALAGHDPAKVAKLIEAAGEWYFGPDIEPPQSLKRAIDALFAKESP